MSDNGVPIEMIADLVGHASRAVTADVYTNPRELHQPGEKPQVAWSAHARNRFGSPTTHAC
jgi:integrase